MSSPPEHNAGEEGEDQVQSLSSSSDSSSASSSPSPPNTILQSSVLATEEARSETPEEDKEKASKRSAASSSTRSWTSSPSSPAGSQRRGWQFSARAAQKAPRGSFLGQTDFFQPQAKSGTTSQKGGKLEAMNQRHTTVSVLLSTLSSELPEFQELWMRLPSARQSSVVQALLKSLPSVSEAQDDNGDSAEGDENAPESGEALSPSPASPLHPVDGADGIVLSSPRSAPQVPSRGAGRVPMTMERVAAMSFVGTSQSSFFSDLIPSKNNQRIVSMDSDHPLFAPGVLQEYAKKEQQATTAQKTSSVPETLPQKTRARSTSEPEAPLPETVAPTSGSPSATTSSSSSLLQPSSSIQSFTTVASEPTSVPLTPKPKVQKFVGDQLQIWSCTVLKEVKALLQLYSKEIENPTIKGAGDSSSSSAVDEANPVQITELDGAVLRVSQSLKNVLLCVKESVADVYIDPAILILENIKTTGTVDEKMIEALKSERVSVVSDVTNVVRKSFQKLSEETESLVIQLLSATFADKSDSAPQHANLQIVSLVREFSQQLAKSLDCLCTVTALRNLEKNCSASSIPLEGEESPDPTVKLSIWETEDQPSDPSPQGSYTLNALVKNLTSTESYDNNFVKTFIMTYRAFTSPWTLFNKLKERYDVPFGHLSDCATIQMRVCIVLKYWIENRSEDFDEQLAANVKDFLLKKVSVDNSEMGRRLLKTLEQAEANALSQQKIVIPTLKFYTYSKQIHPPPWDLLKSANEVDVAKQLTLIDWEIFKTIDAPNFLNLAWDKPKYKHRALNLIRFIDRINKLAHWTASAIVIQETAAQRAEVITKLAKICKELLNINNFHSFAGIIVGFNLAAISRLKFSFAAVHKRWRKEIEAFNTLIDPQKSYKNYRTALHAASPPSIPYIGVYLTDLTFIDEGNPNYIGQFINFSKQELVHDVLREVLVFQMESYNIPSIPNIASYFLALPALDEDTLYKISIEREPRGAKSVK